MWMVVNIDNKKCIRASVQYLHELFQLIIFDQISNFFTNYHFNNNKLIQHVSYILE